MMRKLRFLASIRIKIIYILTWITLILFSCQGMVLRLSEEFGKVPPRRECDVTCWWVSRVGIRGTSLWELAGIPDTALCLAINTTRSARSSAPSCGAANLHHYGAATEHCLSSLLWARGTVHRLRHMSALFYQRDANLKNCRKTWMK